MKDDQLYAVKLEGTNRVIRALGKEWKGYAATKAATLVIAACLSLAAIAQEPLTRLNLDTAETYTLEHPTGFYAHPDGTPTAVILVRAASTGAFYRVAIRMEYLEALKPGDPVSIEERPLQ